MVESHSVYNVTSYNSFPFDIRVKYIGNPTITFEWFDGNGEKFPENQTYSINTVTSDDFLTILHINGFRSFEKPGGFTLIARNEENITMKQEFYVSSDGNYLH